MGVTLVERGTRGLTVTPAGHELLGHVRAMADAAALITLAADGQSLDVHGEVTITATDLLSASALPAILAPLRQDAPGIRLRIVASSDIRNLTRREADIAVRHMRPDQPDLIARHIGDFRANLYAAKDYLDRAGRPRTLRDIADHAFVGNADPDRLMTPMNDIGVPLREENFVMSSESGVVVWEMTKAGYGLSMQPEILGDDTPGIERAFPAFPALQFPIWLVAHRELQTSQRIRLVFDTLARGLREALQRADRNAKGGA